MKKTIPLLLSGIILLSGCSNRYTITTNNGSQIGTRGKPHLKNGVYSYKNLQGEPARISAGQVREVSPSSMADSGPSSKFKGTK